MKSLKQYFKENEKYIVAGLQGLSAQNGIIRIY